MQWKVLASSRPTRAGAGQKRWLARASLRGRCHMLANYICGAGSWTGRGGGDLHSTVLSAPLRRYFFSLLSLALALALASEGQAAPSLSGSRLPSAAGGHRDRHTPSPPWGRCRAITWTTPAPHPPPLPLCPPTLAPLCGWLVSARVQGTDTRARGCQARKGERTGQRHRERGLPVRAQTEGLKDRREWCAHTI